MEQQLQVMHLRTDFYRDGFRKVLFSLALMGTAFMFIIATIVYLYLTKPKPVMFSTYENFSVVPKIPVNQSYLSEAELRQWVSNALQAIFVYDFYHYSDQLKNNKQYFTEKGWTIYKDFLNNFAAENTVTNAKAFVTSNALGAPVLGDKGNLPDGRYAWWVQMQIKINYFSQKIIMPPQTPTIQALVVRVPTTNNMSAVAIENIIYAPSTIGGRVKESKLIVEYFKNQCHSRKRGNSFTGMIFMFFYRF